MVDRVRQAPKCLALQSDPKGSDASMIGLINMAITSAHEINRLLSHLLTTTRECTSRFGIHHSIHHLLQPVDSRNALCLLFTEPSRTAARM